MKFLRCILAGALLSGSIMMQAQDELKPDILFLEGQGSDVRISGMSDDGRFILAGSTIYDITTTPFQKKSIGGQIRDISLDGKVAVGSNGGPAVWKEGIGWKSLPRPQGKNGGTVISVTPDGRYAVGSVGDDGCMWDLSDNSIVELPNRPLTDRRGPYNDPNNFQNYYERISPDGRYVQGILSYMYVGDQTAYVYDRETEETRYVGFKKRGEGDFIPDDPAIHYTECEGMSADGHYLTGCVYILHGGEYIDAFRYDVWNDKFEYFDREEQTDAWGFCVSNDGVVFLRREAWNPYNYAYVCVDGFYYTLADILNLGYGINLEDKYGIDCSGTPVSCSADGKTICLYTREYGYYIVRFKEDIKDVCKRLKLLREWASTPRNGSVMSLVSQVNVGFAYPVETSSANYSKIQLLDEDGNVLASPLANGGLSAQNNILRIVFRTINMEEDKNYYVKIPAGVCNVRGLPENQNEEILIKYTGRKDGAVKITNIFPKPGSQVSSLNMQSDPILVTYDADLKVNSELKDPIYVYLDDVPTPAGVLYPGLYKENVLALYPSYELPLYKGSTYYIKVPEGVVSDISGYGASEAFEITYEGTFVPQIGDEKYIFHTACDNYDNLLFFEGDYGTPTAEYQGMGFTYDTTPWSVVRDNADSTDMAFGSHSSYIDGRQSDDWFCTRQLYIPDETVTLSFDGQSYRRSKEDILKIYVYADDGIINALTDNIVRKIEQEGDLVFDERLDPGATEDGIDGEWTRYNISLDKYAGKHVYIAFANRNQNQSLVMVDNIEVARVIDSFISLTNPTNIIAQEDSEIKGYLIVENPMANYQNVCLKLKDKEGNLVSTVTESGLSLTGGDSYQFKFPENLPAKLGEETHFTIEFDLDDHSDVYNGLIRNLTFEPVKKVVLEEFTGRDCQFCPQGFAMIERLSEMFPNNFIPISLYCYNGTDPKGYGVMDYWQYLGMNSAPSGRINRRPTSMSLYVSNQLERYVYTKNELPQGETAELWFDDVVDELSEPAYIGVRVWENEGSDNGKLSYEAEFKSAVNLEDMNLRVFGVLLENGISDYQTNGVYQISDPLLGEWGAGGTYGSSMVYKEFDHAAKATWNRSFNGTANLLPRDLKADEPYKVEMEMPLPSNINNLDNCEFVVMLIDGNSGRIINAAISSDITGVKDVREDTPEVSINLLGDNLIGSGNDNVVLDLYTPSGMKLQHVENSGGFSVPLNGYRGIVLVTIHTAAGQKTYKFMAR